MSTCFEGRKEHLEKTYEAEHGEGSWWGSDAMVATYLDDFKSGTCLLEAGHEGEHEFIDDDQWGVRFVPAEERPS